MDDYKKILMDDFLKKKEKNSRFSLRAYARYLGISISSVSACLNTERHLSPRNFELIYPKLGITQESASEIIDFLQKNNFSNSHRIKSKMVGGGSDWRESLSEVGRQLGQSDEIQELIFDFEKKIEALMTNRPV